MNPARATPRASIAEPLPAQALADDYRAVRAATERLAESLSAEDQCVQSMPDASPTKWHLAHTSWFFETVVLARFAPDYRVFDPRFAYLFNSYYESLGPRHPRPARGMLTRPSAAEVRAYRQHVDTGVQALLDAQGDALSAEAAQLLTLGLHHEQQHQELILTDIKHAFSLNPLLPAYAPAPEATAGEAAPLQWTEHAGGIVGIGHGDADFAFDNERPRHPTLLRPYLLATRAVSCGEYLAFIADGGYRRPELWLSDGWAAVLAQGWQAPLYWLPGESGDWHLFTLGGVKALDPAEPVCHLSFYEAAAYAEWAGARLPTEFEWEAAAAGCALAGNLHDGGIAHPRPAEAGTGLRQMFGDVWEWTRSSYDPYPGFRPLTGAVGEYNGKFMVGQVVLRGGSCATPRGHIRPTYRNFFPPGARWQFSGLRLARDA